MSNLGTFAGIGGDSGEHSPGSGGRGAGKRTGLLGEDGGESHNSHGGALRRGGNGSVGQGSGDGGRSHGTTTIAQGARKGK